MPLNSDTFIIILTPIEPVCILTRSLSSKYQWLLSLDDSTVFFTRDNPVHTRCEHANNHTTELVLSKTSYVNYTVKLFPIPVKVYIYKIPTAKVLPRHKNVQKLSNLLVLKKQKCYAVLKTHQAKKKWF